MAERKMGIIAFLLCFCLCLMPCCAQAASTADAVEAISPEKECTLTLSYRHKGTAFSAMPVNLYKIAEISANFQYTLADDFAPTGLELNKIQSVKEWNVIRSTLEAYILANKVAASRTGVTDSAGQVCFESLKCGLYLAVNVNRGNYAFDAALIALPGLGADGTWQYQVAAVPKGEELPPVTPDEDIELSILKLWKGDSGKNTRPASIRVEIFRNGKSYRIVTLSAENNWSYKWTAKKDGAKWTVVELDAPSGYVVTVEQRGWTFIITNTLPSDDTPPDNPPSDTPPSDNPPQETVPPVDSPQTGDSVHVLFYTALMYLSGFVLVILGITGKRKRK